jgi:quercetin dioxygenase-like cupin family protein
MNKFAFIFFISLFVSCTDITVNSELNEHNLSEKIAYADKINNKVFYESDNYKMILFAIKKDQVLKPHSAPMNTPLLILEGSARVTIGDEEFVLHEGDDIVLPKDIDHGVYPLSNVKFLLIK